MVTIDEMEGQSLFTCPRCTSLVRRGLDSWLCTGQDCPYSTDGFPIVSGLPALVDFEVSVLDRHRLNATEGAPDLQRTRTTLQRLALLLLSTENRVAAAAVSRMLELLRPESAELRQRPRILVVGGGTVGSGLDRLYNDSSIDLIAFDIYASPCVQFIGDGQSIPLADASIDGVVVQAVLEHVLEPGLVAEEIHRVLRPGGIVYADTPFMYPVHEGPYDFTRYSDSGHRYLFRRFEHIDSGATAGAGTALALSIDRFVRALTRSAKVGLLARLFFFWLPSLDAVLDSRQSLDAASGVFFLGRKTSTAITPGQAIEYYKGAGRRS